MMMIGRKRTTVVLAARGTSTAWRSVVHVSASVALLIVALSPPALAVDASLSISPDVGPPTTVTTAAGSGFAPGERVVLGFDHRKLETIRAAFDGTFTEEVQVPATATPGSHTVLAKGAVSGKAVATFTVRTNWPTARFVPEGTGHNPYENVISPSNVGNLEPAWSVKTEGSLFSTPVVVAGVVYVAGHVGGTGDAEVAAFEAGTGDLVWSTTVSGGSPSDLALAEGKLYVSFLSGHILRAYDAITGDLLWSVAGPNKAPTVVDGVVYAADGLRSLWAIDAQTGRKRWVTHAPFGGYGIGVAVAHGMVYAGGQDVDGTAPVYAYDAATGDLVWRTNTIAKVTATPAVWNETVYVGSDLFYALDARTGRVRWTADAGGVDSSAAVANGVVYVGSTDDNVYAFDAETGEQLWVSPTGASITASQATIVANRVVYVGSIDDIEYAFDAATGEQLWSFKTGVRKQSVVDGSLYVTSSDNYLFAFRLPGQGPP